MNEEAERARGEKGEKGVGDRGKEKQRWGRARKP